MKASRRHALAGSAALLSTLIGAAVAPRLAAQEKSSSRPGQSGPGHSSMNATGHGGAMGESQQMHQLMMRDMEQMRGMKMTGDIDRDYATMMKMHHQQAIEMAQQHLVNGKSDEMKALSKKIIEDQKKEIATFDRFLAKQQ